MHKRVRKFKRSTRLWLNPKKSSDTGTMEWYTELETYGHPWFAASVSFRDCNRGVSLDFGYHDDKTYKERLNKVDTIVKQLLSMRDAMVEAKETVDSQIAAHKEVLAKRKDGKKPDQYEFVEDV